MKRLLWLAILALSGMEGCGGGNLGPQPPAHLQLVVQDAPLTLVAPTSVLIQLLVVGGDGGSVTITSPGAPAFVSITGSLLTLAPTRADAGRYEVHLVATSATQESEAFLHVEVTRTNTGPMWLPEPIIEGTDTDTSERPIVQQATMYALVCDDEGDNITFEVEAVPAGAAFKRVPTASELVDFAVTPPLSYEEPIICGEFRVPLTGLPPGEYDVAVHAVTRSGSRTPTAGCRSADSRWHPDRK